MSLSPTSDVWTVKRILEWTTGYLKEKGSESPRLEAEILLAHTRNCKRIELYTRFDEVVTESQRATMRDLVKRRSQSEPVAYLVGHREFFSLSFLVDPRVLIPRPDTETLVVEVLESIKQRPVATILDLGTGSGCILISILAQSPNARGTAVDLSGPALEVARLNAEKQGVSSRIEFHQGDLFAQTGRFDVIATNPPYIPTEEIKQLDRDIWGHEPKEALDGGADGLEIVRRIISESPDHLNPGGNLFIEIDPSQAEAGLQLLEIRGVYQSTRVAKDLAGRPRVLIAELI